MIRVSHLTKRYGAHTAVSDISFHIEKGKIYGFLGPNGAGKSTTMNMLTGCLSMTGGDVEILGHDIRKEPLKAKRHIGYLPEIPPLYMDMTPVEYLRFVMEARGVEKGRRRAELARVMEKTDLAPVARRLIRHLSKGYRQRVGIAQALIGDPEIIVLDEPTVGLDPAQIRGIRQLIQELGKDHTVILSSHILSEVQSVCQHVLIMQGGKLLCADSTENLKRLMGDLRMTLLLSGTAQEAERAADMLRALPGVSHVALPDTENGEMAVVCTLERDVREDVFRLLAGNDFCVLDMHTDAPSLEDVFLRITEKEGEAL